MIWELVTQLGDIYFFLAVIGILLWTGRRREALGLSLLFVVEGVIVAGLKNVFMLPRPAGATEPSYALPSGHASRAAAMTAFVMRRHCIWLLAIPFAVAVSRVMLGQHFWADVVAGLLLGSYLGFSFKRFWKQFPEVKLEINYRRYILAALLVLGIVGLYASPWLSSGSWFMYPNYGGTLVGLLTGFMLHKNPIPKDGKKWAAVGLAGLAALSILARQEIGMVGYMLHYLLGFWVSCGSVWFCQKLDF